MNQSRLILWDGNLVKYTSKKTVTIVCMSTTEVLRSKRGVPPPARRTRVAPRGW